MSSACARSGVEQMLSHSLTHTHSQHPHTHQVSKVEKSGDAMTVSLGANTEQGVAQDIAGVTCVIWAIGRDANAVDLGLENTGGSGLKSDSFTRSLKCLMGH